eukprot:GFUD01043065.1.p1 GENE.GFUD01043065.1~~GFUD01043065.1.p1  ORF type:complete len:593 (+),score=140.67 GFUD01043065.1:49-1827(+)
MLLTYLIITSLVIQASSISNHQNQTTTSKPPDLQPSLDEGRSSANSTNRPFVKDLHDDDNIVKDDNNSYLTKQINEAERENEQRRMSMNDSFKISDEVEALYLDQINSKIDDFEDLKSQAAVLDRHLRKHSDFEDFNSTDHILTDLDDKVIKPYEEGLKVMKKKIIKSNHEMNLDSINMINTVVDNAEIFLETGREIVESALDAHLASDEHKNEHNHGGNEHTEDHVSDYADLISPETEVDIEYDGLLLEYIDMDIDDFEKVKKQTASLENHIRDHVNLDHGESDDDLTIAENVLRDLSSHGKDMESYQDSLQSLKNEIKKGHGKLNIETIDQISTTLEEASTFLEASRAKLELVGLLDKSFEDNHDSHVVPMAVKDDSHFTTDDSVVIGEEVVTKPVEQYSETVKEDKEVSAAEDSRPFTQERVSLMPNGDDGHFQLDSPSESDPKALTNPVEHYSDKVKEVLKKAAEDSHHFMHNKKLTHHVQVEKKESPNESFPFYICVSLSILSIVLLIGLFAASKFRFNKKQIKDQGESVEIVCEKFSSNNSLPGINKKNVRTPHPQLESVKEDDGWNTQNWAKATWSESQSRRKRH